MSYKNRNLTMMTDLYQLTMMNSYFKLGMHEKKSVFDVFYRNSFSYVSYNICAGLEQVVDYLNNLQFENEDIEYLRSLGMFEEDFLQYLAKLRFTGDVYAIPEGSVIFPNEPILRVEAPLIEAQLIETAILNIINFQTLIASKTSHILSASKGEPITEFGLRRAQGCDAGFYGTRAAYIAGIIGTSNVLAGQHLGIPVKGTHSHSYVMSFASEYDAFCAYAKQYPNDCILLVDTYDTLKSGIPNAIKIFDELKKMGHKPIGIRIDSGDLAYLSKKARILLDEAGHEDVLIFASGDIDEDLIQDLRNQDAKIDVWGVGTRLITSFSNPALGGVYKMGAIEEDGQMVPKMKISNNISKTTNPGIKKVVRIYENNTDKAIADLIMLENETVDTTKPLKLYDPIETWKNMVVENFYVKELYVKIFQGGKLVYSLPTLEQIREYCKKDLQTFWDEYKRNTKPQKYKVDLSDELYSMKKKFLLSNCNF